MGIKVVAKFRNEKVPSMLRRLKRFVDDEGQPQELLRHRHHLTRTQRKRMKKAAAIRRAKKAELESLQGEAV